MLLLGEKKIKFPQAQPWIPTLKPNGVRMQRTNHGTEHPPAGLTNNSAPLGFPEGKKEGPAEIYKHIHNKWEAEV